jgi:hypothetical protein
MSLLKNPGKPDRKNSFNHNFSDGRNQKKTLSGKVLL